MTNEYKAIEFTAYKDAKGFERSLTLRGDSGTEVIEKMDKAIVSIMEKGGTAIAKNRQGYAPKVVDYVVGEVCPLDGGRLINPPTGTNRPIKCENGRYDFTTKTTSGCAFTKWPKPAHVAEVEASFAKKLSPVISKEEVAEFRECDEGRPQY